MAELKLMVDSREFDRFAGYKHTDNKHEKYNETLNDYIRLYKSNGDIRYLQIECEENLSMHTIAYICERVKEKYFIRVDFAESSKDNRYWLCFYKELPPQKEEQNGRMD